MQIISRFKPYLSELFERKTSNMGVCLSFITIEGYPLLVNERSKFEYQATLYRIFEFKTIQARNTRSRTSRA